MRDNEDQRVLFQRHIFKFAGEDGVGVNGKVYLLFFQQFLAFTGARVQIFQADVGVSGHKGGGVDAGVSAAPVGGGNADRDRRGMAAESDVVLKVLLQLLIPPGKIQKKLPLRRGGDGRVGAVKQLEAQLFFQLAQLLGEGRLGDEQVLCRQRDVFAFVYFQHISENVGVHNKASSERNCVTFSAWSQSGPAPGQRGQTPVPGCRPQ